MIKKITGSNQLKISHCAYLVIVFFLWCYKNYFFLSLKSLGSRSLMCSFSRCVTPFYYLFVSQTAALFCKQRLLVIYVFDIFSFLSFSIWECTYKIEGFGFGMINFVWHFEIWRRKYIPPFYYSVCILYSLIYLEHQQRRLL